MKLNTMAKYRWTADLYLPVQRQDGQFTWEKQREVTFDLASGLAQTYVYSKEALDWAGLLLNVTNHLGQKPYTHPETGLETDMFITACSPVFNIYGGVDGYASTLMRVKPNNWEQAQVESQEGN